MSENDQHPELKAAKERSKQRFILMHEYRQLPALEREGDKGKAIYAQMEELVYLDRQAVINASERFINLLN